MESSLPEKACQSDLGGGITTGGGFSKYYSMPSYQQGVVNNYKSIMFTPYTTGSGSGTYTLTANPTQTGRAYPDISLAGANYAVMIGGEFYALSGTSASAPGTVQSNIINILLFNLFGMWYCLMFLRM